MTGRLTALLLLIAACVTTSAWADKPIFQTGLVTPGHVPVWITDGVLGDGGGAQNGKLTELGIVNTGTPLCINDAPTSSASGYHQLCLGALALGSGIISYNAYGGAQPLPLNCLINGQSFPCINTGHGNVVGPTTTTPGDAALWNDLDGTLLSDPGAPPVLSVPTNAALKALGTPLNGVLLLTGGSDLLTGGTNLLTENLLASGETVYRAGFYAAGDGGDAIYVFSTSPCTINGGAGDNGFQVKPNVGSGCWFAQFPAGLSNIRAFGITIPALQKTPATALDTVPVTGDGWAVAGSTNAAFTAQQIADWAFCNSCTTPFTFDGVRGVGDLYPGSTVPLVNGVAGYVMSRTPISGSFPTSVALFGVGIADVDNSRVWGTNTLLSDTRGQFPSTAVGRSLNNEFDFNVTSAGTSVNGLQLAGASLAQPTLANGLICQPLSLQAPGLARWSNCIVSVDASSVVFAYAGTTHPAGANVTSQALTFGWYDGASAKHFASIGADGDNNFVLADSGGGATALNLIVENGSILSKGALVVGSFTGENVVPGDLALTKISPTGGPGAGFLKLEAVAGTTSGTCKLVAYAGTGGTATTIADNIGSGC